MKNRLFLLNGYPRAGKDTFAGYMIFQLRKYGYTAEVCSSVDKVKEACKLLGWNGEKDEYGRNALSSLKMWSTKWFDGPFNDICDKIDNSYADEAYIFMVREPVEIARLVEKYPEIITIFIDRDSHETADNFGDNNVEDYGYEWVFTNNLTKNDLYSSAVNFVEHLHGGCV